MLINETWANDRFSDVHFSGGGRYQVFRADRKDGRKGGGVAALVKVGVECTFVPVPLPSNRHPPEIVCLDLVTPPGSLAIRLITGYRPPNANLDSTTSFCDTIATLCEGDSHEYVFFGDINVGGVEWGEDGCVPVSPVDTLVWKTFELDLSLTQHVPSPTRRNPATGRWSLLDVLFSSNSSLIPKCAVTSQFSTSDHMSVTAEISCSPTPSAPQSRFNFRRARWDDLEDHFNQFTDWVDHLGARSTVDECADTLYNTLFQAIQLHVPSTKPNALPRPSPIPDYLIQLKRRKNRTARKGLNSPRAKRIARDYKKAVRRFFTKKEYGMIQDSSRPETLNNLFRIRAKPRDPIPTLTTGTSLAATDSDKASLLSQHFESVYLQTDSKPHTMEGPFPAKLADVDCDAQFVYLTLKNLSNKYSTGPDLIPLVFYKNLAPFLAEPLSILFRKCLDSGQIPRIWSHSIVTPVYKKKGTKSDPKNWRPISNTCCLCRILERHIGYKLKKYLECNKLLSTDQFGYREKRSTETNLLLATNEWTQLLDQG